jgi:hypothetical protein
VWQLCFSKGLNKCINIIPSPVWEVFPQVCVFTGDSPEWPSCAFSAIMKKQITSQYHLTGMSSYCSCTNILTHSNNNTHCPLCFNIVLQGSVSNRSQMDIKHVIVEPGKNFYFSSYPPSTLIRLSHHFTSALKPTAWSLLSVVSATFAPPFQPLRHQQNVWHVSRPICEKLYATNTSHCKQETLIYEYPLHWVLLPTENPQQNTSLR